MDDKEPPGPTFIDPISPDGATSDAAPTPLQKLRDLVYRLRTGRRPIDMHIATTVGRMHHRDGIPNQDTSFALLHSDTPDTHTQPSLLSGFLHPRTPTQLAGVFDGHGANGHEVARLACDGMQRAVTALLTPLPDGTPPQAGVRGALLAAFQEVAVAAALSPHADGSGSTATVAVVHDAAVDADDANDENGRDDGFDEDARPRVTLAWVGDSAAAVVSDGAPKRAGAPARSGAVAAGDGEPGKSANGYVRFVTRMHRTADAEENARVSAAGASVRDGYVVDASGNNGISVTRTLGDTDMQRHGCISEPQVQMLRLRRDDSVIILASDGLWDSPCVTKDVLLRAVGDKRGRCARRVCEALMEVVMRDEGPGDDCTIVCLALR